MACIVGPLGPVKPQLVQLVRLAQPLDQANCQLPQTLFATATHLRS